MRYGRSIIYLGGDIIVEVDRMPVSSLYDLLGALEDNKPGETVEVKVLRGRERRRPCASRSPAAPPKLRLVKRFQVVSGFEPAGDQGRPSRPSADGPAAGAARRQTLHGVTGSGKTFTMAKIIEQVQLPTLVISHNKTLAAQLYREFKDFFPDNAVEYFVSYYDYYQPEAYVPGRDLYIEKDASINQEIDRMRLAATTSLMERRDVIVVATVSCIYGIGNPTRLPRHARGAQGRATRLDLREVMRRLVACSTSATTRCWSAPASACSGDVLEVYPSYSTDAIRIEFFGDEVERIRRIHPLTGDTLEELEFCQVYPAKYFVMPEERMRDGPRAHPRRAGGRLRGVASRRASCWRRSGSSSRTEYDLEMLREMGYCPGIENYSRHLSGREEGERPAVLIDFFPERFLTFVDESHITLPQVRGMYEGDRSRKLSLVQFGFRLPSALDNRPLYFAEFEGLLDRMVFVSATPSKEELEKSERLVEQLIRPTGLLDPEIEVRPTEGQIEDLYAEIRRRIARGERTLVTTLTKKMAEDLSDYLGELGLKVRYLHSEVETIERVEILKKLRTGEYDVLVGINLLREGLDLPEVSLIAILDADKIGFLRSATSLIQIIGRAARHLNGKVIMYADRMSDAMKEAIDGDRAAPQDPGGAQPGARHHPPLHHPRRSRTSWCGTRRSGGVGELVNLEVIEKGYNLLIPKQKQALIQALEREMLELAKNLEFEQAALVRDRIKELQER